MLYDELHLLIILVSICEILMEALELKSQLLLLFYIHRGSPSVECLQVSNGGLVFELLYRYLNDLC